MNDMKKRMGRIITLLAALSAAAAMAVPSFAGLAGPNLETRLLPETANTYSDGGKYITIISPKDGAVFCTGQDIQYSFRTKDTWSAKDYYTKPYVELRKQGDEQPVYHRMFEAFKGTDVVKEYVGTISGAEISKSQYYVIGATYRFGVANYAYKSPNSKQHDSSAGNAPIATIDITIADHAWDAGVVTKEPDTGEAGTKLFTCARCHKTKTETIDPLQPVIQKKPSSVKVKAKKKGKVTVSWSKIKNTKKNKKLLNQIKSIEVQYSTDPTFIENRVVKKVGKKKTSVSLKLKSQTRYYFRVRYVGKGGTSYWSAMKSVKTK